VTKLIVGKNAEGGSYFELDDELIWYNHPEIGHAFIKLRKQLLEEQIIERMLARKRAAEEEKKKE
jgi:hypothetical protein